MTIRKKVLLYVIIAFIIIQGYRPHKNDGIESKNDFLTLEKAPESIQTLFVNSCYDCHSNTTNYKWFDNIAPITWYVDNNIQKAKYALNFSDWGNFAPWQRRLYLNAIAFDIETDKMPTQAYQVLHAKAKLSKLEKEKILNWIGTLNFLKEKK